ncbi:ThuA domain-containing protein [Acidobacterium sp. S8]|uniref:ThuA domain-containing protein n=1 Tax=Acidobacterium sp. S8 TaxID=1641854 RepID=UPI00131A9B79|nr:ThuA domain-containing protein [Acidobacterium sp. S8]
MQRKLRLSLRNSEIWLFILLFACIGMAKAAAPNPAAPTFRVVALAEAGGIHQPFVEAAKVWLNREAVEHNFTVDYIQNTDKIDDAFLSHYQLFIQLNYPPYNWTPTAAAAFIKYIEAGRGGWIGFHHATLLGEFDGFKMWPWFSDFMGGIRFKDYIPSFADGTVTVEDTSHPVMNGVTTPFVIKHEEWYTWDKSPRPNVHVLATVDENTYSPDTKIKMGGDHPVIWTNEHYKARNIYIFMGHHPDLFENTAFATIFRNSIFWAAHQDVAP